VLVEYLIPLKSTTITQGEHVFFDIDVKGGEKVWFGCVQADWCNLSGFPSMPKGEIVGMFYRKRVLVIDGKNNNVDGK
jgi:hypothetical protein